MTQERWTVSLTTPAERRSFQQTPAASTKQASRLSSTEVLAWSVWLGLAAGMLEVGMRVLCRAIDPTHRIYLMNKHFVWLTPLANMLLFFSVGLFLATITRCWPRLGGWLSLRLLIAVLIQPMLLIAWPAIFSAAWFLFALGIAARSAPWVETQSAQRRKMFWVRSLPVLMGIVALLAASVFGADWFKQRLEARHPLPPKGSPNVLFIVLDTVRADRLSLQGYRRPTTPNLERLAKNGIRFEHARATAPWTLPSHAGFFTGKWPHELGVQWLTPLRTDAPFLAEFIASRGYATAGFVANTGYCSYDSGLARGFTHYEDYVLKQLNFLRTSILISGILKHIYEYGFTHDSGLLRFAPDFVERWFHAENRKDAASINRAFLDWLGGRREKARPFFVFLNYIDAHSPYTVPQGAAHRFGHKPASIDEIRIIDHAWDLIDRQTLPKYYVTIARDAYDSCLAYLDEQLSKLFDELERGGTLDDTVVVITSDHGEGLGEHGLFDHGESLYNTEIDVPLLILLPRSSRTARVVSQVVSLRDLPATIVDLVGQSPGSPFPGHSLAGQWRDPGAQTAAASASFSELFVPNPRKANHDRSPGERGALVAVAEGDFVYIRNEGDGGEELFNDRDDPHQLSNRAGESGMKPMLDRFRNQVTRFRSGTGAPD
jgi:arylsulfatase A-like enzyme